VLLGGAALVLVGLAIGLPLGLTGGHGPRASGTTTGSTALPRLSHAAYAELYRSATIGKTTTSVLARWPKPPYQRYHSGSGLLCYEWFDKPVALYNLCFNSKGVLEDKAIE
jgi:hypothetical protein